MPEHQATSPARLDASGQHEVSLALEELLDSPEFRQSEQSRRLMRHLVEVSQSGSPDQLRERAIGSAVYGLDSGYDTAENPIVRVRVNELRKRLAKHYQQAGNPPIRFEIAGRGYRVEVVHATMPATAEPEAPAPVASASSSVQPAKRHYALIAAGLIALAAVGIYFVRAAATPADTLRRFWGPAFETNASVMICAGHPVVYRFSREAQQRLFGAPVDHYQGQTHEFQFAPDAVLHGRDVVAFQDQYIGLGSAEAVAKINGYLARQNKEAEIRFGNDLTFSELRKGPAVILGAFQNRWTVEFMRGLRFVFDTGTDGVPEVRDTQSGKRWPLPNLKENGQTPEDYVLISRVLNSASGQFVIAAAGITQYGGHTVGEVLSDPKLLPNLLAGASPNWAAKNLQILLKVQIIGKTAGPPQLVALHEWN